MSTTIAPGSPRAGIRPRLLLRRVAGPAFIACAYLFVSIHAALLRPMWFDELSTLFVASTPSMGSMFRAIPADGNPPLFFLLARPLLHLGLKTELAIRIPSILAYFLTALLVYRFVRRNTRSLYAWMAMSLFLGCSIHAYALEARAYSLLLCFTAVTLCSWQSWRRTGKRIYLVAVFLGITAAIFSHQYGAIYSLLPLCAGETVRTLRRRRIDLPLVAACFAGAAMVLVTYPPMLRAQKLLLSAIRACPVFWAHPKWSDLSDYIAMAPPFVPLLIAVTAFAMLLWVARGDRTKPQPPAADPVAREDMAAAAMLALFVPVMLLLTHFGTNYFQLRYGIGAAVGIAILAGFGLQQLEKRWHNAVIAAQALLAYGLLTGLLGLWYSATIPGVRAWQDPILRSAPADEPIAVANALEFSPMWWYSSAAMRARLHYLVDLPYAGRHSDLIPEYSLALERDFTPMQMEDYGSFLQSHPRFILYCYGVPRLEWIKERLQQEGWHLSLLRSAPRLEMWGDEHRRYYREIYQVTR